MNLKIRPKQRNRHRLQNYHLDTTLTGTHSLHSGPGVGGLMLASEIGCGGVSAVVVVDVAVSSGADSMVPLCSGRGDGSFLFLEDPWLSAGS